eukprot:283605_1
MNHVCFFNPFVQFVTKNKDSLHIYSTTIWTLNILLLIYTLLELGARRVKWCKMQHAHIIIILSMISSIISSSFFIMSDFHIFHYTFNYHFEQICAFAPIIAISFRIIAKHFTWGLYIVRGQMVMASSTSKCTIEFSKKAHYILLTQCIIVTTTIAIICNAYYNKSTHSCQVTLPLWLLIGSALIGETCYGLGFMYIFYRAMTKSLNHVYKTLPKREVEEVKRQLRHHITIYFIQLTSSILFLAFVASCICLETLVFFEAELFFSNLCLLLLFRNKIAIFKKAIKSCLNVQDGEILSHKHLHLQPLDISQKHTKSSRNLKSLQTRHTNKIIRKKNIFVSHFLANKWISDTEVINVQKEILDTPTKNDIEMFYANSNNNTNTNSDNDKKHTTMPTFEALEIITNKLTVEQMITNSETGRRRNNTQISDSTTPTFQLDLDTSLHTMSAPIHNISINKYRPQTAFQIDQKIASQSAGQVDEVKTPKQRHSNVHVKNILGMFGNDIKSQSEPSEQLLDDIEIDFMNENSAEEENDKQISLTEKFKIKLNIRKPETDGSDIISHIRKFMTPTVKKKFKTPTRATPKKEFKTPTSKTEVIVDKESLMNEDFASVEPAELRNTLSSIQHEQLLTQIFTPEMSEQNEDNMVYLDDGFDVIDDFEIQHMNIINEVENEIDIEKENEENDVHVIMDEKGEIDLSATM